MAAEAEHLLCARGPGDLAVNRKNGDHALSQVAAPDPRLIQTRQVHLSSTD
jgi:hypothetical protein